MLYNSSQFTEVSAETCWRFPLKRLSRPTSNKTSFLSSTRMQLLAQYSSCRDSPKRSRSYEAHDVRVAADRRTSTIGFQHRRTVTSLRDARRQGRPRITATI